MENQNNGELASTSNHDQAASSSNDEINIRMENPNHGELASTSNHVHVTSISNNEISKKIELEDYSELATILDYDEEASSSNDEDASKAVSKSTRLSELSAEHKNTFPLIKLAYYYCSESDRTMYNSLHGVKVGIEQCCSTLIELNTMLNDEITLASFDYVFEYAALVNHFHCFKVAFNLGIKFNEFVSYAAAYYGRLEMLEFIYENQGLWNKSTCIAAERNGHYDCLKFAKEKGEEWNKRSCLSMGGGHEFCFDDLRGNCDWEDDSYYNIKLKNDKILWWLD